MATIRELEPLLAEPREDLDVEYKDWLNLGTNEHKATLAKAAIALVNHGGGFIVLGLADTVRGLESRPRPNDIPEITQDAVNAAIRRYATPEFHCETYAIPNPKTNVVHAVILVPGTLTEPVMSKRDCPGVIAQNRCYIRKPGPRSEEPQTGEEWRTLLNRCVRAGRDDMLEAIRTIVSGRVEVHDAGPDAHNTLCDFCNEARLRWSELIAGEPVNAAPRFPYGFYEMGFLFEGATPSPGLGNFQERLREARRIRHTGWTPFLELGAPEWAPYPHENFVEAWIGRENPRGMERDAHHSDFWRASPEGKLYTIRGYVEDSGEKRVSGKHFDISLPVWRIGEGILFASRLAETFENVEAIAIYCRFTGLNGRELTSISNKRMVTRGRISQTNEVALDIKASPAQVKDTLAEVVHQLLLPLYERFDFFPLSIRLVEEELAEMTKGRF